MKTLAREEDKAAILERLRRLGPGAERQWGRMSVEQMVCHLSDACRMAMGTIRTSPETSLARRTLVKWIALYAPMRWPPGTATRPEIDPYAGGTRPVDFSRDLAELQALVERLAAHRDWPSHPYFGPLSHEAWLRWGYLHLDHHLRQFGV